MEVPTKIGEPLVLAKKFGKSFILQNFNNPRTGKIDEYSLFSAGGIIPSIFMPVTKDKKVLVLHQFRHGANEMVIEFPGGCPKEGQTPEDVVRTECLEETGYAPGRLIRLRDKPVWFEPAANQTPYWPILALDCTYEGERKLDDTEFIEVHSIPLTECLKFLMYDPRVDSKTAAIAFFAFPYFVL